MDNSYILLLIIKKRINVGTFIDAYFFDSLITYDRYLEKKDIICVSSSTLSEFEFNFFVSYLSLMGLLNV